MTAAVLDAVAAAFADDPATVGELLLELADATRSSTHAAQDPRATDYRRDCTSAAADAARDDLASALDLPDLAEQNGPTA